MSPALKRIQRLSHPAAVMPVMSRVNSGSHGVEREENIPANPMCGFSK